MDPKELFVGRKVWLKPHPLYMDKYPEPYFETEVTYVGTSLFKLKDPNRPDYITYSMKNMKECNQNSFKGEVLLSIDGLEDFARREQKIFRIRRYMNSRASYNTSEEDLDSVIATLKL